MDIAIMKQSFDFTKENARCALKKRIFDEENIVLDYN